jgi:predicted transcriptional regulator
MRMALEMTQVELAGLSGVSQSTIAKIERGMINGSYEAVSSLFSVLQERIEKIKKGRKAKEVASGVVISIQAGEKVKRASEIMREKGFSQLPVFRGEAHVGCVSERVFLRLLREGESMEDLGERKVEEVMEDIFPIVSEETHLEAVTNLLANHSAVLVARRGEITGIITSSDFLKLI